MSEDKIDTVHRVQTPEAIDIILRPAGILMRSGAFVIDWFIRVVAFVALLYLIVFLDFFPAGVSSGLVFLLLFFFLWLYHVVFEVFWQGQTPGKRLMSLKVVQDNGAPITFSTSLIRNLLRTIDGLPVFYSAGILSILYSPRSQRLGDLFSGSLVVYVQRNQKQSSPKILASLSATQAPFPISRDERQAIIAYADRFDKLSPSRRAELANELDCFLDLPEGERVNALLSIAKYLLGGQNLTGGKQ